MKLKRFFMINTFRDKRERMIYYDHLNSTAYVIPKDIESMFKLFQGRGIYAAVIFLFMFANDYDPLVTLLVSLVAFGGLSWYFYAKLLPKLNELGNFDIVAAQKEVKEKKSSVRLAQLVLYLISLVLILFLAFRSDDTVLRVAAVFYSLYALYKSIQSIIILK